MQQETFTYAMSRYNEQPLYLVTVTYISCITKQPISNTYEYLTIDAARQMYFGMQHMGFTVTMSVR
jgi:hypothetical protein